MTNSLISNLRIYKKHIHPLAMSGVYFLIALGLAVYATYNFSNFMDKIDEKHAIEVKSKMPEYLKSWRDVSQDGDKLVRWNGEAATLLFMHQEAERYFYEDSWKIWAKDENGMVFSLDAHIGLIFNTDLKFNNPQKEANISLLSTLIKDKKTDLIKNLNFELVDKTNKTDNY